MKEILFGEIIGTLLLLIPLTLVSFLGMGNEIMDIITVFLVIFAPAIILLTIILFSFIRRSKK